MKKRERPVVPRLASVPREESRDTGRMCLPVTRDTFEGKRRKKVVYAGDSLITLTSEGKQASRAKVCLVACSDFDRHTFRGRRSVDVVRTNCSRHVNEYPRSAI